MWHVLIRLKKLFEHEKMSSMCWDLVVLGFLHVVCVWVGDTDALFWKKEFVSFSCRDAIRLRRDVPFLLRFSMPCGPRVPLWILPSPLFVPTFALISCPIRMLRSVGIASRVVASSVLKFSYSSLSTGWYIEHNRSLSDPLIAFPLLSLLVNVSGSPRNLPPKGLSAGIVMIGPPSFLYAESKVGERMIAVPPMMRPRVFSFSETPWKKMW